LVKFLVIRFSSIGDIVLTTPVIRCLKTQVEGAEIYYLTKKCFSPILKGNPYIDRILEYDNNLDSLIKEARKENIHYLIDLHNNIRSFTVKKSLGLLSFSLNKINLQKWLIVNLKINKLPNAHIVDRYLETARLFDIKNDGKGLDYFIPEEDRVDISTLPLPFQNGYIAFAIGAKHNTKKLPVEKIINICKNLNYPVVILGGKEDKKNGVIIKNELNNIFNGCGEFNINQSASIVKQSKLIIAHDTGLMHIAAAFKKIIISVWGNTIPEFGMYPYLPADESRIFEIKGLPCRPCSKLGKQKCPKKHFKCMNDINEEELANYVKQVMPSIR